MPSDLSRKKSELRAELRKFEDNKIILNRDIFFVSGWTDQACLCWTEPYTESGKDRRKGWEYTVQDWEYIIKNPERMHYLQLVENDNAIRVIRDEKNGKIKKVEFASDLSYNYTNFFQFAELIKAKIREELKKTNAMEFDLVGHSMGGLDGIAAVALDADIDNYSEVKEFIKTKPLEGLGLLITVATPYKGSVPADIAKRTQLDEMFRPDWTDGIRKQCENMAFDSEFIKILNRQEIRERLLKSANIGVHTFSASNDEAVRPQDAFIEGAQNHTPYTLDSHSGRMGIPQDVRLQFELFNLFKQAGV